MTGGTICLRLPTKGDVIVEVEIIEPGFHILPGLADIADALGEKLKRLGVAIRAAFVQPGAPVLDFPWGVFVRRVLFNPRNHFSIALSFFQLGSERFGSEAGEAKE